MSPLPMGLTHVAVAISLSLATTMGVGPIRATAQEGSLLGHVTDSLGFPISGVEVTLVVGGRAVPATTGAKGDFRFTVPAGTHRIQFRRLGFKPITDSVTIPEADVIDRRFVLRSNVTSLDPVVIEKPLTPAMRRFEDRRHTQPGSFISNDDLTAYHSQPLRSVLARKLPGVRLIAYRGALYAASSRGIAEVDRRMMVRALPRDVRSPVGCYLQIFLDGTRIYAPNGATDAVNLNEFQTRDIEAIESYSGANTPSEFSSSWDGCGSLVFWTRLP